MNQETEVASRSLRAAIHKADNPRENVPSFE